MDPARSRLVVDVFRKGLLSPALHDHHFTPERWRATVTFDPGRLPEIDLLVTAAADSLRDRQPELSAADIDKVERQVRGPKVLDAARYPEIRLTARRLELTARPSSTGAADSSADGVLVASLELHGHTRSIRIPVRARWSSASLSAEGEVSFRQSDFGIPPYSTLLGAIAVQDRVSVRFSIEASPDGG